MKIYFSILSFLAITVFLFVIEIYQFGYEIFFNQEENDINIGTLGDFIGGLTNPALSFISFIALLSTIFISIKTQRIQSFDATFNTLIEQHNRILNNIKQSNPDNNFQSTIESSLEAIKNAPSINDARSFLINEDYSCDNYFRLVYQILNLVIHKYPKLFKSRVSRDQKRYSNILRAILDQETLFLIAINAASTRHTPSFDSYKELIEKTNFLEHLKPLSKFQPLISEIALIYNESAFGDSIFKEEIFSIVKIRRKTIYKNKSTLIKKHLKSIYMHFNILLKTIFSKN